MNRLIFLILLCCSVWSCAEKAHDAVDTGESPDVFPDYRGVTIPVNIAPLNFRVRGAEKADVIFFLGDTLLLRCTSGDGRVMIPPRKWQEMLRRVGNRELMARVSARKAGKWYGYKPFPITVTADSVDPYIAYRLIEPGYELSSRVNLCQRELASFREDVFVHNSLIDNNCVNCHSFRDYSPDHFMFHVRQKNGGTVFVDDGKVRKVQTATSRTIGAGSYCMWHPSGRYIAFSTNLTRQAFHALSEKKIEVYDLESDMMIYDVEQNRMLIDKRFQTKAEWETFPAWSPDGKFLYFCRAEAREVPMEYRKLDYGIYRVGFDEQTGRLGDSIEDVVTPGPDSLSVVYPSVSPDGRYLLYTVAEGGVFPLYHKEADLAMIDLERGGQVDVSALNSDFPESYHVWSSSGRWVLFSSRRIDGSYTHLYIAYFDREGKMHKPFVVPQRDPDFYRLCLKSFSVPEFIRGRISVSPYRLGDVARGAALDVRVEN